MNHPSVIKIFDIPITDISVEQLLDAALDSLSFQKKLLISNVNIHAANLAYERPEFRLILDSSNIIFCDGVGIKIAAMLTGQTLRNRHTPPDFVERICALAEKNSAGIFFIGARPGAAEKAADLMRKKFPALRIGAHHGYFDKLPHSADTIQVVNEINVFGTDFLFVGFGMPLQEEWIAQNISQLKVRSVFPVGALFDYMAGEIWRAPRWMTDNGLEWLGRLFVEPGRLWKRYIIGNPLFFWRVFIHHILGFPLPKEIII